jgi:hypothetical protein
MESGQRQGQRQVLGQTEKCYFLAKFYRFIGTLFMLRVNVRSA